MLQHGEFGKWLETEVDFSTATADNYMKLFQRFGTAQSSLFGAELNSQTFVNLSYSKALRLLAVPEEEQEAFVKENNVEHLSTREMDELIKQRDAAIKAKDKAEEQLRQADEGSALALGEVQDKVGKLREAAKEKDDRIRELTEKLAEMKAEPIDVIVAPEPDPEKLAEAIGKARAEAAAEKQKEIDKVEKDLKAAVKEKSALLTAKELAERNMKNAQEELAAEREKTAAAERKAAELRKAQAMSDPVVTEFGVIFGEVQTKLKRLKELTKNAGENAPRLEAALAAMLKAFEGGEATA